METNGFVVNHGHMAEEPTDISTEQTMRVGAIITAARTQAGLSRSQLSRDAGVSEVTMMRIEAGITKDGSRYLMRPTMAFKVASALDLDPNELLEPLGYTLATQAVKEDLGDRIMRLESAMDLSIQETQALAQTIQSLTEAVRKLNPRPRRTT